MFETIRIDMIHHNPGEAPFDTRFADPSVLRHYGANAQCFKHINCVMTLDAVAPGVFPADETQREWLAQFTADRQAEIDGAKAAGLQVFYHVDLIVLPKAIVETFQDEIIDPKTGIIDFRREKTKELHRAIFDELFARFPDVDGLIIRVGETYLFDTPYHIGNGAVPYGKDVCVVEQQDRFVDLIHFLKEEICERHQRLLIHRTWDTRPDRFHADLDYYLAVTDRIEPHPNLIFSIKHTQVDFHRWTRFNPCLTKGHHPQVVEVQCQREYEGKGAYPNYSTRGVIDGFDEMNDGRRGLSDIANHPLIRGVYTWSRGGGWYGPHIDATQELWCALNTYVIHGFARDPSRTEEELFREFCHHELELNPEDTAVLRDIACDSLQAVLEGKCCRAFDEPEEHRGNYPTNQWMRDDRLGGMTQLGPVFDWLIREGKVDEALSEKDHSVHIWRRMLSRCEDFSPDMPDETREVVQMSVEYGLQLFRMISAGWALLMRHRQLECDGIEDTEWIGGLLADYDRARADYQQLGDTPRMPSLYRGVYWHWPHEPEQLGLDDSVEQIRQRMNRAQA